MGKISRFSTFQHMLYRPQCYTTIFKREVCCYRLTVLPRGFGSFAVLEVLDLTYNNLSEASIPNNFWSMMTLRALYFSDNDFETIPAEVGFQKRYKTKKNKKSLIMPLCHLGHITNGCPQKFKPFSL